LTGHSLPNHLSEAHLSVDPQSVRLYAQITDDFNPIHLDPEFAKKTMMGGIIAHGTMSLNLIWQALRTSMAAEQVRSLDLVVRFVRPVRLYDTVTAGGTKRDDNPVYDVWVRNQKGEDVISGTATLRQSPTGAA
jgi:acyl dehydratase